MRIESRLASNDELPEILAAGRPGNGAVRTYYQITVADEGIGFDEKYLDRIFQVFKRLHGKNQYPGTGVGLAICRRVVDNHEGTITATSQPDHGATFIMYLPVD